MRLINCEMRPGRVLEVLDNNGTIKASAEGLFCEEDVENLPPVRIWLMGASNAFTSPKIGQDIWVLFNHENPEQLYWFRRDDFSKNNGALNRSSARHTKNKQPVQAQKNVEVLTSCESKGGWATIYFSDGTGWIVQNNEVKIQLDQDGNIILSNGTPHGTISITDDGISLGTEGKSAHPACHGDRVQKLFENIIDTLQSVAVAASGNIYTVGIATAITKELLKYKDNPHYINSDHVTLD